MLTDIALYSLLGYLSGSVLYSKLYSIIFRTSDISINSRDHSYGVINAFKNGGWPCGLFTLLGDMLKGFIPVFFYMNYIWHAQMTIGLALVMCAPVLGDCFSCFNQFKGGKGIFTSLGVLLGLLPEVWQPLLFLGIIYITFNNILIIKPLYYQLIVVYVLFLIVSVFCFGCLYASFGSVLISFVIIFRLILSPEHKEDFTIIPVWKQNS